MHVCFLNGALRNGGGGDRWLFGVMAGLREERSDVRTSLVVGQLDASLPAHERARLGEVVRLKGLEGSGLRPAGRRGATERLRLALEQLRPDVVHCNDVVDPALLEIVAATGKGVATVQDHRSFCPGPGKVLPDGSPCRDVAGPTCSVCLPGDDYRATMLALTGDRLAALRGMRVVTVLSRAMASELVAAGLAPEQVKVVPPFVDHLPRVPPTGEPTHHLFVGRLAGHKGVGVALAAALRPGVGLPLVVAGDGALAPEVASAAAAHPERVRAVGWVDRLELAHLLAHAATLWMPSIWAEPFGIVGLEALWHEVPVIGSGRGGMSEWLRDGEVGRVVPPEPGAVAAAAGALVDDRARREAMGGAGRRLVERHYTRSRALAVLEPIYREVARRG